MVAVSLYYSQVGGTFIPSDSERIAPQDSQVLAPAVVWHISISNGRRFRGVSNGEKQQLTRNNIVSVL